jgi:hypothetical protein
MEKMRSLDGKLKHQIDRLIKLSTQSTDETAGSSSLRPNPSALLSKGIYMYIDREIDRFHMSIYIYPHFYRKVYEYLYIKRNQCSFTFYLYAFLSDCFDLNIRIHVKICNKILHQKKIIVIVIKLNIYIYMNICT